MAYNVPVILKLLNTQTASSSGSLAFTSTISSTYSSYYIAIRNLLPATNATSLYLTFSTDNGSSYLSTNYRYMYENITSNANAITGSGSAAQGIITATLSSTSSRTLNGDFYLINADVAKCPDFRGICCHYDSAGFFNLVQCETSNSGTTAVNAIKFAMASGNIASGTITMYGVAEP